MPEPETNRITRRQFAWNALGYGATATLAGELTVLARRAWARRRDQSAAASRPDISGANSLESHAAARGLLYGAAVDPNLLDVKGIAAGHSTDAYTQLVAGQTGVLVAENAMKWAALRPTPTSFNFTQADRLMRFAELTQKRVRGHNLCWHEALPYWFSATATKENARQLLTDHIRTVAGHFRGRIHSWDVVNEAIHPEEGLPDGLRDSPWLRLIGPDYIELAFRTAAEADPNAILTYNDYDIEADSPSQVKKRAQVLALLRRLKTSGVPIGALGIQSHLHAAAQPPGAGLTACIRACAEMNLQVFVTEMDVNCHGLDLSQNARDEKVAQIYRDYLGRVLAEPNVPIVLTWGITSAHTWLNSPWDENDRLPGGVRQRPLPFDDDYNPTPAFFALRDALDAAHPQPHASAHESVQERAGFSEKSESQTAHD
jgi:endo-1,4-beta-xylanase